MIHENVHRELRIPLSANYSDICKMANVNDYASMYLMEHGPLRGICFDESGKIPKSLKDGGVHFEDTSLTIAVVTDRCNANLFENADGQNNNA